MTSRRKSNFSFSQMTLATSFLCSVLRCYLRAWKAALCVISVMKSRQASAKRIGASLEIILTSSSDFMIFLMRAKGSYYCLKSFNSFEF